MLAVVMLAIAVIGPDVLAQSGKQRFSWIVTKKLTVNNALVMKGTTATTGAATFASTVVVTGNVTAAADLAVNGADLTSDDLTFGLLDVTPTLINLGGNAALNIGKTALATTILGTANFDEAVTMDTSLAVAASAGFNGAGVTSDDLTFALFDITPTLINLGGNAALNIGKTALATTVIGTFNVDEAATLDSSLGVTGDTTLSGATIMASANTMTVGATTETPVLRIGATITEGWEIRVLEDSLDLSTASATEMAMTTVIPTGAVILSVQTNNDTAITAGGTSVDVSVGVISGDVDKYGTNTSLAQNAKIDTIPTHAVLSGTEQIGVHATVTGGASEGDTNWATGTFRIRVTYMALNSLDNI